MEGDLEEGREILECLESMFRLWLEFREKKKGKLCWCE